MLLYVTIIEAIYKAVEVILTCLCLTPKKSYLFTFLTIWIPTSAIQVYSAYNNFDSVPVSLLMFAIYITLTCLLFKDKGSIKGLVSFFLSLICAIVSVCYFALSRLRGISHYFIEDRLGTATCLIIMCVCEALFVLLWQKKARKITISGKDLAIFMILPVSQAIISVVYQIFEKSNFWSADNMGKYSVVVDTQMIFFITYMILFIISDFFMFYLLTRISAKTREEEELKFSEIKNKMDMDYYRTLEENSQQIHKIRHDIVNYVTVVGQLVNDGNNSQQTAQKLIEEMNLTLSNIPNDNYCLNKLVNIILCQTAKKCIESNIRYDFSANIPTQINIEEIDLCRAMTNIIDNAITAAQKCDGGWISIDLSIIDDYLYIKSSNSFTTQTDKNSDIHHGYGHKILKDIANKYNGVFVKNKENEKYSVLMTMKTE